MTTLIIPDKSPAGMRLHPHGWDVTSRVTCPVPPASTTPFRARTPSTDALSLTPNPCSTHESGALGLYQSWKCSPWSWGPCGGTGPGVSPAEITIRAEHGNVPHAILTLVHKLSSIHLLKFDVFLGGGGGTISTAGVFYLCFHSQQIHLLLTAPWLPSKKAEAEDCKRTGGAVSNHDGLWGAALIPHEEEFEPPSSRSQMGLPSGPQGCRC